MNPFIPSLTVTEKNLSEFPGNAFVFAFRGKEILMTGNELPRVKDFSGEISGICIGTLREVPCIGIAYPGSFAGDWNFQPLRAVIHGLDEASVCAVCRAKELMFWRDRRKFCGACGAELTDSGSDSARICPVCREHYYPQIAPAVITAVLRDGKLLLAHNRNFTSGVFSLIAGFVESGETLEQAVAREIREETSIRVKNIRYYSSQPWPFPNSLMLGFVADYDSGEVTPDGVELESAGWYSPDEMPLLPDHGSIARKIIDDFRANKLRMM